MHTQINIPTISKSDMLPQQGNTILIKTVMTKKEMINSRVMFGDKQRQTALITHMLHGVVSQNTILSANEQRDIT